MAVGPRSSSPGRAYRPVRGFRKRDQPAASIDRLLDEQFQRCFADVEPLRMDLDDKMGPGRTSHFHHGFKRVPESGGIVYPEPIDEDLIIRKRDWHLDQCRKRDGRGSDWISTVAGGNKLLHGTRDRMPRWQGELRAAGVEQEPAASNEIKGLTIRSQIRGAETPRNQTQVRKHSTSCI